MGTTLVCENCGSSDVDGQGWVNLNTLEFQEWCDDDTNFCNSCMEFVKVRTINQEEFQKILLDKQNLNKMLTPIGDEDELDCE